MISGYLITLLLIGEHERTGGDRPAGVLAAAGASPAPGAVHHDGPAHGVRRALQASRARPASRRRAGRHRLRLELVPAVGRPGVHRDRGMGAAAPPLEPRRGGAVLPRVAVGDGRPARPRATPAPRDQPLAAAHRARRGRRRGLLYYPGHDLTAPSASWTIGGHPSPRSTRCTCRRSPACSGLLIGAAFAMLWRPSAVMRGPLRTKGRLLDVVGTVGLVALVFMALSLHLVTPAGADPWLFRGGFIAVDLATIMVIAAVTHRGSHVGRLLGTPTLAYVGTRSLRAVPVPLADLRDHPRRRRQPHVGRRVRHGDGAHGGHHRGVVPLRRDPDPPATGRRHARSAARRHEPRDPPPGGHRRRRPRCARRVRRREPGDRVAAPERLRRVQAAGEQAVTDIAAAPTTPATVAPTAPSTIVATATTVAGGRRRADDGGRPRDDTRHHRRSRRRSHDRGERVAAAVVRRRGLRDARRRAALSDAGFVVDAHQNRQLGDYLPVIQQLAASGRLTGTVVVHLGTNGGFTADQLDAFMEALAGVPQVLVLTDHAQRSWIAGNNQHIAALQGTYPNVLVGNWDALAADCPRKLLLRRRHPPASRRPELLHRADPELVGADLTDRVGRPG